MSYRNLYVVCSKTDWDSKYNTWGSGGQNFSLDNSKVQFSNIFTGAQVKTLATDSKVTLYNNDEILAILNSAEWKEPPPVVVTVNQKFKDDYELALNKLDFLKEKLGLE